MDFEQLANSLGRQFAVIFDAPVPFIVATLIAALLIWRAMQWRYAGTISRLENDVEWARSQIERTSSASAPEPALPETENPMALSGPVEEPPFLPDEITLERLVELRKKATGIHGDRQIAAYEGKRIHFDEEVKKTGLVGDSANVKAIVGKPEGLGDQFRNQVTFWFRDWPEELEMLDAGDRIKGYGTLQDIGPLGIIVGDCHLTD